MKIVLIETNSTADFDPENYPRMARKRSPEMEASIEAADVVIGMFSPHAPLILKGDVELIEWRSRSSLKKKDRWVRLDGSADEDETAAQNERLRGR